MATENNDSDEFLLGRSIKNSNKVVRLADRKGSAYRTSFQLVNLTDRQKRIKERFEKENGFK
tara:strand:+ start:752 stop:937 length:186 start_codon:yes stop_codon:yes gene_type:complete